MQPLTLVPILSRMLSMAEGAHSEPYLLPHVQDMHDYFHTLVKHKTSTIRYEVNLDLTRSGEFNIVLYVFLVSLNVIALARKCTD